MESFVRKKREGVYAILLIFLIFVTSLGIDVHAYESKKDVSIDYRRIPSEEDRVESAEEFFRRDGSAAESSRGGSADEESAWREDGAADGSRGAPADENATRHEDYASELAQSEFSDKKTAERGADASDPAQGELSTEEGIRNDICEEETEDELTLYSADYEAEDENVIAVWQEENGIAYFINQDKYYQDEEATVPLSGLLEVGGFCYMFEADGSMVRSAFYAHAMETDPDGGAKICYYDESGHMLFGQKKIDGFWYIFDKSTGAMRTGFVHIPSQNKTCYYDENGEAGSGLGRMLYGQKKIKGYWYNFKQGTGAMQTGFVHIPSQNKICYYDENGKAGSGLGRMLYGQKKIKGCWYNFKQGTGAMQTGFVHIPSQKKTCYYDENGKAGSGLGRMRYGQKKIKGYWYMFRPGTGAMVTGFYDHTQQTNPAGGPKKVYYDEKGKAGSGLGRMLYGKQQIGGKWYRFHEGSGAMLSGKGYIPYPVYQEATLNAAASGRNIYELGGAKLSSDMKKRLQNAINKAQSGGNSVGFMLVEIKTGKGVAYNADQSIYSASSVKGPYVAAMTWYRPESFSKDRGTINSVLAYSDNEGYNALHRKYGTVERKWAKEAGADSISWGWGSVGTYARYSARNLAKMWMLMYSYFEYDEIGKKLAPMYEQANVSEIRLAAGGKVRTKAGWTPSSYGASYAVYNDAGIVYDGDNPYILAFMSTVPSESGHRVRDLYASLVACHKELIRQ